MKGRRRRVWRWFIRTARGSMGKRKHYVAVDPSVPVRHFGYHGRFEADGRLAGLVRGASGDGIHGRVFEVHASGQSARHQAGLDCQWQLMSYGLLRGAFRAPDELCPLRS